LRPHQRGAHGTSHACHTLDMPLLNPFHKPTEQQKSFTAGVSKSRFETNFKSANVAA